MSNKFQTVRTNLRRMRRVTFLLIPTSLWICGSIPSVSYGVYGVNDVRQVEIHKADTFKEWKRWHFTTHEKYINQNCIHE